MPRYSNYANCLLLAVSASLAFSAQADDVLDWDLLPAGIPSQPVVTAEHSVSFSTTDPGGALVSPPGVGDFYDVNGTSYEYVVAGILAFMVPDNPITLDIDISGEPSLVSFDLYDVDGNENAAFLRQELYTITASYEGSPVSVIFSPTAQMTVSGDTVTGVLEVARNAADSGLDEAEGILGVSFAEPVDHISIEFGIDLQVLPGLSTPGYALGNIYFTDLPAESVDTAPVPTAAPWALMLMALALAALGRRYFVA